MHKRVSADLKLLKYAIYPVALICIIIGLELLFDGVLNYLHKGISFLFILLFFFAFRGLIHYLLRKNKVVKFDGEFIYLFKGMEVETLPFSKVVTLSKKGLNLNGRNLLSLVFIDKNNQEQALTFFPRLAYLNLNEFCKNIERNSTDKSKSKITFQSVWDEKLQDY